MEQLVARWAHNPKVVSSSLAPATKNRKGFYRNVRAFFYFNSNISLVKKRTILQSGPNSPNEAQISYVYSSTKTILEQKNLHLQRDNHPHPNLVCGCCQLFEILNLNLTSFRRCNSKFLFISFSKIAHTFKSKHIRNFKNGFFTTGQ